MSSSNALQREAKQLRAAIAAATQTQVAQLEEIQQKLQALAQAEEEERERKRRYTWVVMRTVKTHHSDWVDAVAGFDTEQEAKDATPGYPYKHHRVEYKIKKLEIGVTKDIGYSSD
jgi:succinylglutamate desuccinylase